MNAAYHDDRLARRNLAVLVAAQSVMGGQLSMIFITGGLVGQSLAPSPCVATLPLSIVVLGSALSARPLANHMARHGRRAGFLAASAISAAGAVMAALAVWYGSFVLLLAGSLLTGVYMTAQGFFRFAVTDHASPGFQPKAISFVLAGGLVSAVVGPAIVRATADLTAIPFLATFIAAIVLNLLGPWLFLLLAPEPAGHRVQRGASGTGKPPLTAVMWVAMLCATVAFAMMNLPMNASPLAMVGCGYTSGDAASAVSAHVLAMYAPSFFTGYLVARFGRVPMIALGLTILAAASFVSFAGVELWHFHAVLILLGLGWNFAFIGATALLTAGVPSQQRPRLEGTNDMFVFAGAFVASLAAGGLMNCSGAVQAVEGWHAVNLATLPFIAIALALLLAIVPRRVG